MADVPKTRLPAPVEEAERLRDFVRAAELMNGRIAGARVARTGDAAALGGLLAHESIGPRIYTMPNPINAETMTAFIADHPEQRERGEGILFASFNAAGEATAYFDVELWPQWSVAKFGGAVKAERQGRGFGGACGLAALMTRRAAQKPAPRTARGMRATMTQFMAEGGQGPHALPDLA